MLPFGHYRPARAAAIGRPTYDSWHERRPPCRIRMTEPATPPADDDGQAALAALTAREAELLREAGERVFALSRDLAEGARERARLEAELAAARARRDEAVAAGEAAQRNVAAIEAEAARGLEERAELRQLITSLDGRLRQALAAAAPPPPPKQPQASLLAAAWDALTRRPRARRRRGANSDGPHDREP